MCIATVYHLESGLRSPDSFILSNFLRFSLLMSGSRGLLGRLYATLSRELSS